MASLRRARERLAGALATTPGLLFCFLSVAFAAYAGVLRGAFVFDDDLFIVNNDAVRSLRRLPELLFSSPTAGSHLFGDNFYRPLQMSLFNLLHAFFGLTPLPFHAASI